ncbi:MAG: aldo/keto reductase, partial [Pseudomonadota bacterium]
LKDWEVHLDTLREMKEKGEIRYIGITTSHGRDHRKLEAALKKETFDFVQFSYSIASRTVENRLLPLAYDNAIAVITNRNFQRGQLFSVVKGKELPAVAKDIGCTSWAQFFLKYAVSHPAVTCAIPATKRFKYMVDNMQAARGALPNRDQRRAMEQWFSSL